MRIRKLIEKIDKIEWILGESVENVQYFCEHALGRGYMKRIIQDLGETVTNHICKIIYLKDSMPDTVHHWYSEIQAPLNWIIDKETKGGKLKTSLLVEWLNDGVNSSKDMNKKRVKVAKYEKISLDKCKPLDEKADYKEFLAILTRLCELTIKHKYEDFQDITIEEIETIIQQ